MLHNLRLLRAHMNYYHQWGSEVVVRNHIQLRIYKMKYNGLAGAGFAASPINLQQQLNLPSPRHANPSTKAKSMSAQAPLSARRPSANLSTPRGLAARQGMGLMTEQPSIVKPSNTDQMQTLRGVIRDNQTDISNDGSHLHNAPKNQNRKQKSMRGKKQNYMTPKYLKSTVSQNVLPTSSIAGSVPYRRGDSSSIQNNGKSLLFQAQLQEKQAAAAAAKGQNKRPPLRALQQNNNAVNNATQKAPPLPPSNATLSKRPPSQSLQQQSRQLLKDQPLTLSNSNFYTAPNDSCEDLSTPKISVTQALALNMQPACVERFVSKQDSDQLPECEERQKKQFDDFREARTSLYEFQVRKSPTSYSGQERKPEDSHIHLQIPKFAEHNNKDLQMMYQHPYAPKIEDESTRMYSKRIADDSGSVSAMSRAIMMANANQNNSGVAGAGNVSASELSMHSHSNYMQEQKQRTLTQSLFSALGSLIQGNGTGDRDSNQQLQSKQPQSARVQNEYYNMQNNFGTVAAQQTKKMTGARSGRIADHELIKIRDQINSQNVDQPSIASHQATNNKDEQVVQWLSLGQLPGRNQINHQTESNSMRLNALSRLSGQNWRAFNQGYPGRNEVLKTQTQMNGYSTFSQSRSPMKARQMTQPPIQPQEDEIVESMNIMTLDMIPEDLQAIQQHPAVQQRATTMRDQTVCSCSGCMASQTGCEPMNNEQNGPAGRASSATKDGVRPTRICLETVLSECDQVRSLLALLKQPRSTQLMILNQKRILLDRIQTYCEDWWGSSSQFHNLHAVFDQDGTPEGQNISTLIKKSQVVLCVAIGLVASLSIDVQSENLERAVISQSFWLPRLVLQDAYMVQMKLASIILRKMDRSERRTNEFAIKLQERIDAYRQESGAGNILPPMTEDSMASVGSCESENSADLESLLSSLLENQINLMEQQCSDYVPAHSKNHQLYANLFNVAEGHIEELSVAKDLIVNEVRGIQENVLMPTPAGSDDPASDQVDPYGTTQREDESRPSGALRPPGTQATPQLPSTNEGSLVENALIPIEEHLQQKQRILTQGHLSEIGEEPINVLSTEQNVQPSVERDISRISSHNSSLATKNNLAVSTELKPQQQQQSTFEQKDTLDERIKEAAEQVQIEPSSAMNSKSASSIKLLPPTTKKYTLVLDLDETLIHSHVQYKQAFKTRQQQQDYLNDLANKFYQENRRQPSKEELENLALEMVFNIRPFAEEFLNTMSRDFEIVIFTAGEQDYADEILNTLDQAGSITHRLYRQHTVQVKDKQTGMTKHYIKDLLILERPLSSLLIIDNIKENFCRQNRNGIQITTWKDDPYDTELLYLQRLLLNIAKQGTDDLRINLDRLKDHGLLPQHYNEPIFDDSSSSMQHFEPVIVAQAPFSEGEERKQDEPDPSSMKAATAAAPDEIRHERTHSQSAVSVDESCHTGSVRKQSVTNSKYQRRRLSAEKFQGEPESPESCQDGKKKNMEEEEDKDNSPVPECFFVDDVPIRVDLQLETPLIIADGRISEEPMMQFSTTTDQQKQRSATSDFNKNSAFVEPNEPSDF